MNLLAFSTLYFHIPVYPCLPTVTILVVSGARYLFSRQKEDLNDIAFGKRSARRNENKRFGPCKPDKV